jgi:hypothetical protein
VEVVCGTQAAGAEEMTMTEYLISFNDEWVAEHTAEQLREKGAAARVVLEEMQAHLAGNPAERAFLTRRRDQLAG